MSVWSLCEHHMLPMNLQVTAGYVPDGEVVGLSKFGRIAQRHAGRLQVQERFTRQVAEDIASVIGSDDVAVAVRGTHLCMSMRGVRMEAARTTTLQAGGRFGSDPVLSQQFLTLATGLWGAPDGQGHRRLRDRPARLPGRTSSPRSRPASTTWPPSAS